MPSNVIHLDMVHERIIQGRKKSVQNSRKFFDAGHVYYILKTERRIK